MSRGLVKVAALHAAQDKEISRGVSMDTTACSRRGRWGGEDHLRENPVHTLEAARGHRVVDLT